MIQKNVNKLVLTIKSWSDGEQEKAIFAFESLRDCFGINECLAEIKEEDGQEIVYEGSFICDELTKIIKTLKGI